ncbi:MAG: putative sulfate exporter family transporter [Pseudomonadales bacterium]
MSTTAAWHAPGLAVGMLLLPALVWYGNPAVALLVGGAIALSFDRAPMADGGRLGGYCLQAAIVLLGLTLDVQTLWRLSAEYSWAVAGYVLITLAVGLALGRALGVEPSASKLVSGGTAICGGTAIATLSGIVRATPQQTGLALAIVFLLNGAALFTFPAIGRALSMSELEFGLWAALAIHDTSSVVATAALYGDGAAQVATTVKLGRTLWLIPLAFVVSVVEQSAQRRAAAADVDAPPAPRLRVPGFIVLFVAAAVAAPWLGLTAAQVGGVAAVSKALLVLALFLVGTGLSRATVARLRGRMLWQALALWLAAVPATLVLVRWLA